MKMLQGTRENIPSAPWDPPRITQEEQRAIDGLPFSVPWDKRDAARTQQEQRAEDARRREALAPDSQQHEASGVPLPRNDNATLGTEEGD